jgi:hypothetical protein
MVQKINADDGELCGCQQKNPIEAAAVEVEVGLAFIPARDGLAIWTSRRCPWGLSANLKGIIEKLVPVSIKKCLPDNWSTMWAKNPGTMALR